MTVNQEIDDSVDLRTFDDQPLDVRLVQTTFMADQSDWHPEFMPEGALPGRMKLFTFVYLSHTFGDLQSVHQQLEADIKPVCAQANCQIVFVEPRILFGPMDSFELTFWLWMPSKETEAYWLDQNTERVEQDPRFDRIYCQTPRAV